MDTNAKIQMKIGDVDFHAEGDKDWVASQLDKVLEKTAKLIATPTSNNNNGGGSGYGSGVADPSIAQKPLATFLKEKNATAKQVVKFLATAVWLDARGKNRMTTSEVAKAIKDASQSKLNNPSDCLAQNVAKGFCDKDGTNFYVTDDGRNSLG